MKVAKGEGQGTLKIGIIEGIKVLIPADASQNSLTSLNKGRPTIYTLYVFGLFGLGMGARQLLTLAASCYNICPTMYICIIATWIIASQQLSRN